MSNLKKLRNELSQPTDDLVNDILSLEGDVLILGAGGKMGPDLSILAKRALMKAGKSNRVIALSRFSEIGLPRMLHENGIETIQANLLEEDQLMALPDAKNIIYMTGMKFGTTGNESLTWAMNSYLPGRVAEKYKDSRIVAFSTGNVYPFVSVISGGATEQVKPDPVGEYAQSCLGRERIFEYFSGKYNTPILIYRLNYAIDFKYGVLLDIAQAIMYEKAIDLCSGYVNVIWQGDANEFALRSLKLCETPPALLNVTGHETLAIRWLAEEFGARFGKTPHFINQEQPTALLSNASKAIGIFGYPKVTIHKMIDLVSIWLIEGGEVINKPTHFQERKGDF